MALHLLLCPAFTTSRTVRRHTRIFTEGLIRHPFAAHDDFIDAVSRIYDIDPQSPVPYEPKSTESIEVDDSGIDQAAPEGDGPD